MKKRSFFFAVLVLLSAQPALAGRTLEKWQTSKGVSIVFYPAKEVPILDVSLAFAAGSAYDKNHYGLSALTARMVNQGSAGQSADVVAQAFANIGTQFDIQNSRDMVALNLRTLSDKDTLERSLKTFAQILSQPDFPDAAFKQQKAQMLMGIKQIQESPDDVALVHFYKTLYQEHPYAHPIDGTSATVQALTKHQVQDFYKKYYTAKNAVLVLVGDIDSQTAHRVAEQLTQGLASGEPAKPILLAAPLKKALEERIDFPSTQTVLRLGQLGITHTDPDYFPLMLGNYILGGGSMVSRLAMEVREKRGLTYGVGSQFVPMPGDGPFIVSLSTKNAAAADALQITQKTLDHFVTQGPNAAELESAKNYLIGSFPLSLASNRDIAAVLLRMSFYHLPDEYLDTYTQKIKAVTAEEVKQAFQKNIHPDKLLLVRVGQL